MECSWYIILSSDEFDPTIDDYEPPSPIKLNIESLIPRQVDQSQSIQNPSFSNNNNNLSYSPQPRSSQQPQVMINPPQNQFPSKKLI